MFDFKKLAAGVKGYFQAEELQRASDYTTLVCQCADGTQPGDAAEVAGILRDAGKSVDDLQADVERLLQRQADSRILDDRAGRQERFRAACDRQAEAEAERADAIARLDAEIQAAASERRQAERALAEIDAAERRLKDSSSASLHQQFRALAGQARDLEVERRRAIRDRDEVGGILPGLQEATSVGSRADRERNTERFQRAEAAHRAAAAKVEDLERRMADLRQQQDRLRGMMLEPTLPVEQLDAIAAEAE